MAPRRSSVKNKHAFSYGVCPFCNKEILEGEPTNIEHVFPNNQINRAYGTMFNGKRAMTLNIEKSISVLVHKKCNEEDAGLEKKISDIINYLLDPNVSNKQLSYGQIKNIFKFGEKVAKFLPYLPDLKGQFTPPKNFDRVRIFRNVLPLGMIVREQGSVMISFPGIMFEYLSMDELDLDWGTAMKEGQYIRIRKHEHGYESRTLSAYKIVEKNQFIRCTNFHEYMPFLPDWDYATAAMWVRSLIWGRVKREGEVGVLLSRQDIACLKAVQYSEQESICNQLNLKKLVQSGDISQSGLNAKDWQESMNSTGGLPSTFIEGALKRMHGKDIGKKINWLSKNRKFKVPDDVIDMVIYEDGYLKIFHKVEWVNQIGLVKSKYKFINTATLEQGYEISKDVLLAAEDMETIDDLSKCKVNGSVVLTWNNLQTLKGSPYAVSRNFYCDNNMLTTLDGAPRKVGWGFCCSKNQLTSLAGAPQSVGGDFDCSRNELKLFDCPKTVIDGEFRFDVDYLESLNGLPKAKKYVVSDCGKEFDTADELRAWFAEYKKERDGGKKSSGLRAGAKRVGALGAAADAKRKTKPDNQKKK